MTTRKHDAETEDDAVALLLIELKVLAARASWKLLGRQTALKPKRLAAALAAAERHGFVREQREAWTITDQGIVWVTGPGTIDSHGQASSP